MLGIFNVYFLGLVFIVALISIFKDAVFFMKEGRKKEAKKAKYIGIIYMAIAFVMYISSKLS